MRYLVCAGQRLAASRGANGAYSGGCALVAGRNRAGGAGVRRLAGGGRRGRLPSGANQRALVGSLVRIRLVCWRWDVLAGRVQYLSVLSLTSVEAIRTGPWAASYLSSAGIARVQHLPMERDAIAPEL